MTTINDIVLVYFEDQPFSFARVEEILPDIKRDWFHVKLLLLQVPLQTVTWILKNDYINGAEFTMGGRRMRIEKIETPDDTDDDDFVDEDLLKTQEPEPGKEKQSATVVSITDRKPKK